MAKRGLRVLLLMASVVFGQRAASAQVVATLDKCASGVLQTPAAYLEHVGDSDKSISPIALATKQLNEQELRCATPTMLSVQVFLVSEKEIRLLGLWQLPHFGYGEEGFWDLAILLNVLEWPCCILLQCTCKVNGDSSC
jgi:hypothetical protein